MNRTIRNRDRTRRDGDHSASTANTPRPSWARRVACAASLTIVSAGSTTSAKPPSFTPLGGSADGLLAVQPTGISDDGEVVAGLGVTLAGFETFRWTRSGGLAALQPPTGWTLPYPSSVSGDGATLATSGLSANGANNRGFRFSGSSGEDLGLLADGTDATASDVSRDGSRIVGGSYSFGGTASTMWTESDGLRRLVDPGASPFDADIARVISADGSAVAGTGNRSDSSEAYLWTAQSGMTPLGWLGDGHWSVPSGISDDGAVVVGSSATVNISSTSDPEYRPFRWTSGTGMIQLPSGDTAFAHGLSGDGSMIVGSDELLGAVFWDHAGIHSLQEFATQTLKLNLDGWRLTDATAISGDGSTIAGRGLNPDGIAEAFVLVVPAPGAGLTGGCAMIGFAGVRRRRALM